jgi:predicted transcriptional regulator
MTASPDTLHYIRLQLLQLLAVNPHMSQQDLSRKMGVALGRVNYCLSGLKEKGYSKTAIINLYRFIDWVLTLPEALGGNA